MKYSKYELICFLKRDKAEFEKTGIKADYLNEVIQRLSNEHEAEDCISRKLLQVILCCFQGEIDTDTFERLWKKIKSMPSVYPKSDKPSGKWNHIKNYYICSECDCGIIDYEFLTTTNNYCRFCGAKMEQ